MNDENDKKLIVELERMNVILKDILHIFSFKVDCDEGDEVVCELKDLHEKVIGLNRIIDNDRRGRLIRINRELTANLSSIEEIIGKSKDIRKLTIWQ